MIDTREIVALLAAQVADVETQWSLGTFGGIAEFVRDLDEPVALTNTEAQVSAVTARGGIRIAPPAGIRLFASESATRDSWSHRVSLCLPTDRCAMSRRTVLTELGPDGQALRQRDRDAVLFDLGLDALQTDLCIRMSDPAVLKQLRECAGRALFEPGNPAMSVILSANPHRVFVSRVGRIEVFQPIPPLDGTSPQGPHTHVMPKLLQHRRTHAATEPAPDGWVPCAHFYPAHPAKDALGRRTPFDAARHAKFQDLLAVFGDAETIALKQRVAADIARRQGPWDAPAGRFARSVIRVTLRQLQDSADPSESLAAWRAAYDRLDESETSDNDPADAYGHQQ